MNEVREEVWRIGQEQEPDQARDHHPAGGAPTQVVGKDDQGEHHRDPGQEEVPQKKAKSRVAEMPLTEPLESDADRCRNAEGPDDDESLVCSSHEVLTAI